MCHHYTEARSIEAIRRRHRSEEADERLDETPDAEAVDDRGNGPEEREPPAEPRTPADD
ncbi:hypothetical protein [Halorubrum salipaludis]|uniref:hypothetical protein n=1 Tax=Halorubrum salipaludis TaxID=2032630 RepID=UPI0018E9C78F|nr:hypothetical protein [Halorubrum salipaludis]